MRNLFKPKPVEPRERSTQEVAEDRMLHRVSVVLNEELARAKKEAHVRAEAILRSEGYNIRLT